LLLEKKRFPREKICGDAICTGAQIHLKEMGVLQEIASEKKSNIAQNGGFISPNGNACIVNATEVRNEGAAISIKRSVMDEKVAKAAQKAGCTLKESHSVERASFDKETGLWTVVCKVSTEDKEDSEAVEVSFYARVLVCADGASSTLATKMGLVNEPPQAIGGRSYVKDNKLFKWDGVVFYPPQLLPGYCAIFREAGDELNFCTYIIPGGSAQNENITQLHEEIVKNDPYVSKCLGPNPNIERVRHAPIRYGGIPKSYGHHLLIVGDAAGLVDPLTGEGIQYAMESGKIAAEILVEGLKRGDVSEAYLKRYHKAWHKRWSFEFRWSLKMSLFLKRNPIFLDATANMIKKKGSSYFGEWTQVMTGTKSKTWFLWLRIFPAIVVEAVIQAWANAFGPEGPKPVAEA